MSDVLEKQKAPYVLLDIGGTQIKGGLSDSKGDIMDIQYFPSNSKEGKEEIFDHFAHIINTIIKERGDVKPRGIGFAFPGPFDYTNGFSLMKGLNKYDSIYGISITAEIRKRIKSLNQAEFLYLGDVEAFAIGESWFGEINHADKLICLCIGTGAGSAFLRNRMPVKKEELGVPANGWIYSTPYKESIIDDYLSARGLERISLKNMGSARSGKELYELCMNGNREAKKVYQLFGEDLKMAILPFLDGFQPDGLVIGGQISKSFPYFGQALRRVCEEKKIKLHLEHDTSLKAMQGLMITMEQEGIGC